MKVLVLLLLLTATACQTKSPKSEVSVLEPEVFLSEFIPENQMAHAGVFSANQQDYYYTLSDVEFNTFTIMHSRKLNDQWMSPDTAFFNSEFNEHGIHFTTDDQYLYFSSTRPVESDTVPDTWHIWRCKKNDDSWSAPEFVNIPGLSQKLVSHPSSTSSGRLYFHVANTDYSDMSLYYADPEEAGFSLQKVDLPKDWNTMALTPFVAPDESYLLFARISEGVEELYITYADNQRWQEPIKLSSKINSNNLGNPYVTADGKYLFYASGKTSAYGLPHDWVIKRVSMSALTD